MSQAIAAQTDDDDSFPPQFRFPNPTTERTRVSTVLRFPLSLDQRPRRICELANDYREPMRPLIAIAVALTVLGSAACSSGDDADPATTLAPSTSAVATEPTVASTEPEPTTTVPPATTPATEAPTTTIDPTEALIADIEADLNAGEAALMAAGADPSNPELRAELEKYFSGDALGRTATYLDELVATGLRGRPGSEVDNFVVIQELVDGATPDLAVVILCRVDATVIYEPVGETEAIVNDRIVRTISEVTIEQPAGVWQLRGDGESLARTEGATTCD